MTEIGNDAQMSLEQAAEMRRRLDLDLAREVEEERKTAAQPVEDEPQRE